MDYGFRIYEKETNNIADNFRNLGNYTGLSKKKAIDYAIETLNKIGKEKYFAVITAFDWAKGHRNIGAIKL